jgi:hypothetical protein
MGNKELLNANDEDTLLILCSLREIFWQSHYKKKEVRNIVVTKFDDLSILKKYSDYIDQYDSYKSCSNITLRVEYEVNNNIKYYFISCFGYEYKNLIPCKKYSLKELGLDLHDIYKKEIKNYIMED